jgi:UDP-N-acetylmuramyl pentapeptide phosphotransferase/UDP-N-acetylglucosamine-1-phosphate transferase
MIPFLADQWTDSMEVPTMSVDDVMSPYIYVFYAAFLMAFFFTPLMRYVALYYKAIDYPDLTRKSHKEPVAYLGGVAVFLGWLAALATSQFLQVHRTGVTHLHWPIVIVFGAVAIVLLGLWDDLRKIRPMYKIIVQVLAALILLSGHIGTHCAMPLLAPIVNRLPDRWYPTQAHYDLLVHSVSSLLTIALVVGCCNATNLMDGLDGLCGGVSAIIAAGFVFLAVHMATVGHLQSTNNEGMRVVLGLALLGAVLGHAAGDDGRGAVQMVPGSAGHARAADAGHRAGVCPKVRQPPAAFLRRSISRPSPVAGARIHRSPDRADQLRTGVLLRGHGRGSGVHPHPLRCGSIHGDLRFNHRGSLQERTGSREIKDQRPQRDRRKRFDRADQI